MRAARIERVVANNEMVPHVPGTQRWIQYLRGRHLFVLLMLAALVLIISGSGWLWLTTPDVRWLRTTNPHTTAMMRQRQVEQSVTGQARPSRWEWVGLSQISPYLIQSVVEAEDARFFDHRGFDWENIWNALLTNFWERRIAGGGSTLTQQVARNLFLSPSRTPIRKLREAVLAYRLERDLTKARILELYLNIVEWGPGVYGAEAVARAYFHKSAAELRLSEAVRLAAVLPNPLQLSPLDYTHRYLKETSPEILNGLVSRGWISRITHEQASRELGDLSTAAQAVSPVFVPLPHPLAGKFRDADYWIGKMSMPDRVVMNAAEIAAFNEHALIMSGGTRVLELPDVLSGKGVTDKILEVAGLGALSSRWGEFAAAGTAQVRYDRSNRALDGHFYRRVMSELNVEGVSSHLTTRYALVTKRADVLAWPTDELIMDKPGDYAFNAILQSTVYVGTPVAVVHISKDRKWAFIRSEYFDGWIKEETLARTTREGAGAYPGSRFLVVTAPSVRSASGVELMMGTAVRMVRRSPNGYVVKMPARGNHGELVLLDDVVRVDGISEGFLPYTRRSVLEQAFKLLDAPYSWGGSNSGFDCSTFVRDVFAVFGISLPRNSTWQAEVGRRVAHFKERDHAADRLHTVYRWQPGVTLLRLPGHLMMYVGEETGKPYAIHAVWGVKNRDGNIMKIEKVAITDLDLGRGAKDGSLLERMTDAREVALQSSDLKTLILDFADWLSIHPLRIAVALGSVVTAMLFVGAVVGLTARRFRQRT
jgi:monofunctional biosynthetic peptidoglycan transglycosylase